MRNHLLVWVSLVLGLSAPELAAGPAPGRQMILLIELQDVVRVDGSVDESRWNGIEEKLQAVASVQRGAPLTIHGPPNTPFELVVRVFDFCKKHELKIEKVELHHRK